LKILWVNGTFLHPTNTGGQVRTLGLLRELHKRHEIHYLAFQDPAHPEAVAMSTGYASRAYPIPHQPPARGSPSFIVQAAANLFSPIPLAVYRYRSAEMARKIRELRESERFESVVCDFLFPAPNFDSLAGCVLFEHNVETAIWERHAENARNLALRAYFTLQARRMFDYERRACRQAGRVIAVSPLDATRMRERFGLNEVWDVPTGVDVDYFAPREPSEARSDLVFVGSMDWLPNIDAVTYFIEKILPLIRERRPDCSLTIAGRRATPAIQRLADADPRIRVTGTVPDIRPYLWGAAVSIVPLRVGSGTRLKIYEAMAAGVAIVSTTIGAEGLEIHPPDDIRIADDPAAFARECLELIEETATRRRVAEAGRQLVSARFSWDRVAATMEELLVSANHD
jgi:glycosyltransferase involved in cell wall biosynthesis